MTYEKINMMVLQDYMEANGLTDKKFAAGIGRSDSWVSIVRNRGSMATNDVEAIKNTYGIDISKGPKQKRSISTGSANGNVPIDPAKLEQAVKKSGLTRIEFEKSLGYNSPGWVPRRMETKRCTMQEVLLIKSLYGVDIRIEQEKKNEETEQLEKKIDALQKTVNDLADLILSQYGEIEAKIDELYKKEEKEEHE